MERVRPDKGWGQDVVWDEANVEVAWAVHWPPDSAAIVSVPVVDIGRRMQRARRAIAEVVRHAATL
jgi:hypothetical protein